MMEKPYVNRLSGDTLPGYRSVQQYFQEVNNKKLSMELMRDCLNQGFEPEDVELIIRFYKDLRGKADPNTLKILSKENEIPKVRFGELSSENVSFDAPMEYLKDPSVIVAEMVISTNIYTPHYQERDLDEHIKELQTKLKGAGIEETINVGNEDNVMNRLCSLRLTVPQYRVDSFQKKRNAYQKLITPDYSRLDELVNAVELVQGAFQEIIEIQDKTRHAREMQLQMTVASACNLTS